MQLWHWVLLFGLVFLISYSPRTGNLRDFFDYEISEGDRHGDTPRPSRKTQSNSNTGQHDQ